MAQLADWEKRQTNVRPYVRAHGMQRLPCSHVLWRRHGGARTRYTISSEMGQRCDAWQVSASCSPNTRKSGSFGAEVYCSDVTGAAAHWPRGSTAASYWLAENQNKPTSPASELTRNVTIQSSLHDAPPPLLSWAVCDGTAHRLWQEAQEAGLDHCARIDFCCHTKAKQWITVNFSTKKIVQLTYSLLKLYMELHASVYFNQK